MLTRLQAALPRAGLDRTKLPLPMDAWFGAPPLRQRLQDGGFTKSILAGKSHYPFTIDGPQPDAAPWKNDLVRRHPTWGIAVPSWP